MGPRRTIHTALALGAVSLCAAGFAAAGAIGKSAPRAPRASAASRKAVVVKTKGREVYLANPANPPSEEDAVTLGWTPATIRVHSGQKVTFIHSDNFGDPHVLAISPKKDVPKTPAQGGPNNPVFRIVAKEVLNDPSNPQDGFKTLEANRGKNGLNTTGDAIVLLHKGSKITWFVSAKPGTTLYYFCLVHPWMHGKIIVEK